MNKILTPVSICTTFIENVKFKIIIYFFTVAYIFGYEVGPNGQFHHENKGPDGFTYGCYGYVDPEGKLQATHYISDGWGYRVVTPGESVEIFHHKHDPSDDNKEHEHPEGGSEHEHHGHHGVVTAWGDLYFPKGCGGGRPIEGTGQLGGSGSSGYPNFVGVGQPGQAGAPGTFYPIFMIRL